MKLCSYTNFGALFSTVDVDFRFFAYIKIFGIAKFVYSHFLRWYVLICLITYKEMFLDCDWSILVQLNLNKVQKM